MVFLAFFVILPLGLLGFEVARSFLIQQELRNIADSAALSGTAAMASAPETDPVTGLPTTYAAREILAMTTAIQTFTLNSIVQTPLTTANVTGNQNPGSPSGQTPALHNAVLNILLLDQNGHQVATGSPAATMTVQAYWTDAPIFLSGLLKLPPTFTLCAISNGGLPQLDVILCMDISGSMDDQTHVWFVNRYWDSTTGGATSQKMVYNTAVKSPTGVIGHGDTLYNLCIGDTAAAANQTITGTALNVYPPQNLADATYTGTGANTNEFLWSETPAVAATGTTPAFSFSSLNGLRSNTSVTTFASTAMPEAGMPPGNYNSTTPTVNRNGLVPTIQDASGGFTDMVVDMGYPATVSFNGNSYTFTNVQAAVEASRGNMESSNVLKSACCGSVPSVIVDTPRTGYFGAYWNWVLQNAAPIATARQAAYNFFNTMNLSANCHFGLVCFSSQIGTSPTSVFLDPAVGPVKSTLNIDPSYPLGGTGTFPNPLIQLSQGNTSAQEFAAVTQAVEGNPVNTPPIFSSLTATQVPLRAEGGTDISDALQEAVNELKNASDARPSAKKAIVLFTDGTPNLPGSPTAGASAALNVATTAGTAGIPIYTIGLSQNPSIQGPENTLLGDSTANPGIAFKSQNNAIYVPVTSSSQLDQAFQTIARSLCVIQ
jgi:von Willebrand factor type A domain